MELKREEPSGGLDKKLIKIPFCGVGLILVSTFSFAIGALFIKLLNKKHEVNAFKCLTVSALLIVIIQFFSINFNEDHFLHAKGEAVYLQARAICGAIGAHATSVAVINMPLGDATAVIQSSPAFVALISCICFGGKCRLISVLVVGLNIVGLLMLSKLEAFFPPEQSEAEKKNHNILLGFSAAMITAIVMAFMMIFLERLKKTPINVTVFWWSLWVVIIGSPLVLWKADFRMELKTMPYFLGLTLVTIGGQLIQAQAFRIENAGILSIFRSSQVIFGYIFQLALLGESLDLIKTLGALIILISIIITGLDKYHTSKKEKQEKAKIQVKQLLTVTSTKCKQTK